MKSITKLLLVGVVLCSIVSCQRQATESSPDISPTSLPFQTVSLDNMDAFEPQAGNWSLAAKVWSDYQIAQDIQTEVGTGVLINQNTKDKKDDLRTTFEHGDIELDLEFMMPKGSNSGIYLQGRYEIQLLDSWGIASPTHGDCGGIYQRWDDTKPEGQKGYEGVPPRQNASLAPGLWQHLYIKFKAPRFDDNGKKIQDAVVEKVVLNNVTIHENVTLNGMTRGHFFEKEAALGPIIIQGDHGAVAFRNIKYKKYTLEQVALKQLEFKYYEIETDVLPDFDTLSAIKSGAVNGFYIDSITEKNKHFAIQFKGKIDIPKDGEYIFHTISNDGSKLYIDGDLVVSNDFKHDMKRESGLIYLTAGEHDIQVDYFELVWGYGLRILYEGPEIEYQELASPIYKPNPWDPSEIIAINPKDEPEMLRCFINYNGKKRTHAIAVGHPKGIHYSLDLTQGTLLHSWKGDYADVTGMWHERGESQLLIPLEVAAQGSDGFLINVLADANAPWSSEQPPLFKSKGYTMNEAEEPIFKYILGDATVLDHLTPNEDGSQLIRQISASNASDNLYCRIGHGDYIAQLRDNFYSIGGKFYITIQEGEPIIRQSAGSDELLFQLKNPVKYSILW